MAQSNCFRSPLVASFSRSRSSGPFVSLKSGLKPPGGSHLLQFQIIVPCSNHKWLCLSTYLPQHHQNHQVSARTSFSHCSHRTLQSGELSISNRYKSMIHVQPTEVLSALHSKQDQASARLVEELLFRKCGGHRRPSPSKVSWSWLKICATLGSSRKKAAKWPSTRGTGTFWRRKATALRHYEAEKRVS